MLRNRWPDVIGINGRLQTGINGRFDRNTQAFYGFILFMAAFAYLMLTKVLIAQTGNRQVLVEALGKDSKTKVSVTLYAIGIGLAFWQPLVSFLIYIIVAMMWVVPDTRIESKLHHAD